MKKWINSLPMDKILDRAIFKEYEDNNLNVHVASIQIFIFDRVEKIMGKRNMLAAFSAFPKISFERIPPLPWVVKTLDCVV